LWFLLVKISFDLVPTSYCLQWILLSHSLCHNPHYGFGLVPPPVTFLIGIFGKYEYFFWSPIVLIPFLYPKRINNWQIFVLLCILILINFKCYSYKMFFHNLVELLYIFSRGKCLVNLHGSLHCHTHTFKVELKQL